MTRTSFRSVQQIRLWVYCVILMLVMLRVWSGKSGVLELLMFGLIGALFYIEICPVCGRLCWWELGALRKWPNALWIGRVYRRVPGETARSSSDLEAANASER